MASNFRRCIPVRGSLDAAICAVCNPFRVDHRGGQFSTTPHGVDRCGKGRGVRELQSTPRNPKKDRRLCDQKRILYWPPRCTGEGSGRAVSTTPCVAGSDGNSGEAADDPRAQASGDPGDHSGPMPTRPVACLVHVGVALWRAVREVGPRPDPTRSARAGEPSGLAGRPGMEAGALATLTRGRDSLRKRREEEQGSDPLTPGSQFRGGLPPHGVRAALFLLDAGTPSADAGRLRPHLFSQIVVMLFAEHSVGRQAVSAR